MRKIVLSLLILFVAVFLRFYGIDWDQGYTLHPDERFLLMVTNDSKLPNNLADYLNPLTSTLNPYNINHKFFVYGTFPTALNKYIASVLNIDDFDHLRISGRVLSATFDLATIIAIFLIVELLERIYKLSAATKYLACFFYAIAVMPIQQSHFFTVDCFQTCAVFFSLYFALSSYYRANDYSLFLSAITFSIGLGSKVSAVYILPLVLPLLCLSNFFTLKSSFLGLRNAVEKVFIFTLTSYLCLRFVDPKFFADGNFLNPRINPQFLANIKELSNLASYSKWPFPPSVQWLSSTPIWSPLKNLIVYGVGLPYAFLALIGAVVVFMRRQYLLCYAVVWAVLIFAFQGSRFVHSMRYFFVLFPLLALLASIGIQAICQRENIAGKNILGRSIAAFLFFGTAIWPIAFMNIYKNKHSRVTASEWIFENFPDKAVIATEHWDDGLPLLLPKQTKTFTNVQLPVFAQDDEQKWQEMNQALAQAEYIVFSSNRGYGSLMPLAHQIPRTVRWYRDLFDGRSNFKLIKEVTAYPAIDFGFWKYEFNTQKAEEAFSVYDHPKVSIFRRAK